MNLYILDGENVILASVEEYIYWIGNNDKTIARTEKSGVLVSTVFLCIDHRLLGDDGPPLVFETMIFGGGHDGYQERYSTIDAARAGHLRACELAFSE